MPQECRVIGPLSLNAEVDMNLGYGVEALRDARAGMVTEAVERVIAMRRCC